MWVAFYLNGSSPLDVAIRKITRSSCSHCELVFDDCWIGASHTLRGVRKHPGYTEGLWEHKWIDCDVEGARAYAESMVGMKYDYTGALRLAVGIIPQAASRWYCSELVAVTLWLAGYRLKKHAVDYSPGDLWRELVYP